MDGLIKVALIKSAKFDYTEVNVDGNSLFIGANGAGKTTLLRAILYFYTGSTTGLGISSSKKISFSEYYFEYENSYIVYVYKKDDKYVLVTVYKESGVKFRFTLCNALPNIKDIYIDEETHKPKEKAKLFLTLKELGTTSNVISGGVKYKEILYSRNNTLRYFSLFEAREYDGFVKTLSNIFINSKVDSDIIKKVIVSSLNIQSDIDLSTTKRHLEGFNGYFEDIKSYEKQTHAIKKIVEKLNEYEQTKVLLQDDMSTLLSSKKSVEKDSAEFTNAIQTAQIKQQEIETALEYVYNLYTKRKDKHNQTKGLLDGFIKKANEKKAYYEKNAISSKIQAYENLGLEQNALLDITSKKEFLTKEFSTIEQNHLYTCKSIENNYSENKNTQTSKLQSIQNQSKEKQYQLKEQEQEELSKTNSIYIDSLLSLKDTKNDVKSEIQKQKYEIQRIGRQLFCFENENKLIGYNEEQRKVDENIKTAKEMLNTLDNQLTHLSTLYDKDGEFIKQNYEKKLEDLRKEIESLKKLLYPKENTLISRIYKHSKKSDKYLYYLKEDILNSDAEVEFFKENVEKNNIFEITFQNEEISKGVEQKRLEKLEHLYEQTQKSYQKELENLEKKFGLEEKRVYSKKKQFNSTIKENEIQLITLNTKITNLKELEKKQSVAFESNQKKRIAEVEKTLQELTKQLEIHTVEESEHTLKKENHFKKIKSKFTKEQNKLNDEYSSLIESIKETLKKLEITKKNQLEEQKRLYHQRLKENNVDVAVLKDLETQEYKQKERIEKIESYLTLITLYRNDLGEYLERLASKKNELTTLKETIKNLNESYQNEKESLENDKKEVLKSIEKDKEQLQKNTYLLNSVESFENSATFQDCIAWGVKYKAGEDAESIEIVLARVDNLANRYKTYYGSIEKSLGKLHNIFENSLNIHRELDSLQTAYKLKEFYEFNKIENVKSLMSENLNRILSTIIKEYDILLNAQGQIESLVKKITKTFNEIKIGVIDTLALRYSPTNNKIIETFAAIKTANEENSFSYGFDSLFGGEDNSKQIVELLKRLVDLIEFENVEKIELDDSFILEFRVVENGNDSQYVQSLDMIGSNGTDVLVKSMVYVAMLHIFKEKITKKEMMFQVVLDEVGILSQRYLKELIEFANNKGILFVNGAPDEKLIGTYKRVSLISKINKISVVKELIIK